MTAQHLYRQWREIPPGTGYEEYLDPTRAAVVSIDMHEGHLSERDDCPCPAPRGREIVAAVDDFHRRARSLGVPVIHVRSELRASGRDDVLGIPSAWRLTSAQRSGPIRNNAEHALAGSRWTQFRTRVRPEDEVVTGKKRLSAFYSTDLDFLLRQLNIRAVILNGIMTDCCVLNTAFEASNMSYRTTVLADLTRGTDEELEGAALDMVSLHLGLVTRADDLIAAWQQRRPAPPRASSANPIEVDCFNPAIPGYRIPRG